MLCSRSSREKQNLNPVPRFISFVLLPLSAALDSQTLYYLLDTSGNPFLSLSSAAEAENGAKLFSLSDWLSIQLPDCEFEKFAPDTLHVGPFGRWRATRPGNKSCLAQALWCDWRAVSGSFGQQKSISLTGKLRTHSHRHIIHTCNLEAQSWQF